MHIYIHTYIYTTNTVSYIHTFESMRGQASVVSIYMHVDIHTYIHTCVSIDIQRCVPRRRAVSPGSCCPGEWMTACLALVEAVQAAVPVSGCRRRRRPSWMLCLGWNLLLLLLRHCHPRRRSRFSTGKVSLCCLLSSAATATYTVHTYNTCCSLWIHSHLHTYIHCMRTYIHIHLKSWSLVESIAYILFRSSVFLLQGIEPRTGRGRQLEVLVRKWVDLIWVALQHLGEVDGPQRGWLRRPPFARSLLTGHFSGRGDQDGHGHHGGDAHSDLG